jgi:hypothetical protein
MSDAASCDGYLDLLHLLLLASRVGDITRSGLRRSASNGASGPRRGALALQQLLACLHCVHCMVMVEHHGAESRLSSWSELSRGTPCWLVISDVMTVLLLSCMHLLC